MKFCETIIVGLLLLTIIIGGVSATEDISVADEDSSIALSDANADSSISLEEENTDSSLVAEEENPIESEETNVEDLKEDGSSDREIINVTHGEEIVLNQNDYIGFDIAPDANGTLKVWMDDEKLFDEFVSYARYHDPYGEDDVPYYVSLYLGYLTTNSSSAIHTLNYEFDSNMGKITGTSTFKLLYLLEIGVNDYPQFAIRDQRYGETVTIHIRLPERATGYVDLILDGQAQRCAIEDGYVRVPFNSLSIGTHTISVEYGDNKLFYDLVNTTTFNVKPMIEFNYRYDLYPNDFLVDLILPADANGKLVVFDYYTAEEFGSVDLKNGIAVLNLSCVPFGDHVLSGKYVGSDYEVEDSYRQIYTLKPLVKIPYDEKYGTNKSITFQVPSQANGELSVSLDGKPITVSLVDGKASIKMSNFSIGEHKILFDYNDDYYGHFAEEYSFDILPHPVRLVAKDINMSYYDGTYFKVTVYGKDGKIAKGVNVTFYVNGKKYKTVKTDSKGIAQFKIVQVPKTYKIAAKSLGETVTKKVIVKRILVLKAVKIKKSARKLVLTASLKKVKGKYLKNKLITFKFNGKTYKAKTNSKGVAKVTIKKAVLKKLKVGKKVKYQATYVKDTVKKSATVKR